MFHMLSCFNLKAGETIEDFSSAYTAFVEAMQQLDLVESSGPIGLRQQDTPMDTDVDRKQNYFSVMSFRDRTQVDTAYAHILRHVEPGEAAHNSVYARVLDPIFICWQDL